MRTKAWVVALGLLLARSVYGQGYHPSSYVPPAPPPRYLTTYSTYEIRSYQSYQQYAGPNYVNTYVPGADSSGSYSAPAYSGPAQPEKTLEETFDEAAEAYRKGDHAGPCTTFRHFCHDYARSYGCTWLGYCERDAKHYGDAAMLYHLGCNGGDPYGCGQLGWAKEQGLGDPKDVRAALKLYQQACQGKADYWCTQEARLWEEGKEFQANLPAAYAAYRSACQGSYPAACSDAARLVLAGKVPGVAKAVAYQHYRQGCEKHNDPGSCIGLAQGLSAGFTFQDDPTGAEALLTRHCYAGVEAACVSLSELLRLGVPGKLPPLPESARQPVQASCLQKKLGWSCIQLGYLEELGVGGPKSQEQALAHYQQACEGGTLWGCYSQGWLLLEGGPGRLPSPTRAVGPLEKGCSQGLQEACVELARAFRADPITQDLPRARQVLQKSCDQAHWPACRELGRLLLAGGPGEPVRGLALLERGCRADHQPSCASYGLALLQGQGSKPDPERGLRALREGCERKERDSCWYLGRVYRDGLGVAASPSEAHRWFGRACGLEDPDSCTDAHQLAVQADLPGLAGPAQTQLTAACDRQDPKACLALGRLMWFRAPAKGGLTTPGPSGSWTRPATWGSRRPAGRWPPPTCPVGE